MVAELNVPSRPPLLSRSEALSCPVMMVTDGSFGSPIKEMYGFVAGTMSIAAFTVSESPLPLGSTMITLTLSSSTFLSTLLLTIIKSSHVIKPPAVCAEQSWTSWKNNNSKIIRTYKPQKPEHIAS